MKFTLFNTIAALFLVLGSFFPAAWPAQAQTLILPQQLSYAGLTFSEPLSYSKELPVKTETLTFTLPETIHITNQDTKEVLGEAGFSLIPGEAVVQPTLATAVMLPLLPSQTPPAAFQSEESEDALTPVPSQQPKTLAAGKSAVTQAVSSAPLSVTAVPPTGVPVTVTSPPSTGGGLDAEKLFAMSNAYRASKGLAPFQKDERACTLAASRAPEINSEIAAGAMHSGLRARALPYWNSENIISMRTEEAAFNWWINDKIHHDAIVGSYTYSCVACSGNSCAQEFTNFQPI